ncbi:uncharacterized protein METZ01_LOCUS478818, partial [marine metagenome]
MMSNIEWMDRGYDSRLARIKGFLSSSRFQGFTRRDLFIPSWHAIAALSNMAEAITNLYVAKHLDQETASNLLEKIAVRAVHPKVNPYRRNIDGVKDLYKWGYYLEHLNICLGALGRVRPDSPYTLLNKRVSKHLR